jgi:hypothetical protein
MSHSDETTCVKQAQSMIGQKPKWLVKNPNGWSKTKMVGQKPKWLVKNQNGWSKTKMSGQTLLTAIPVPLTA